MTITELIKRLQQYKGDAEVFIEIHSDACLAGKNGENCWHPIELAQPNADYLLLIPAYNQQWVKSNLKQD